MKLVPCGQISAGPYSGAVFFPVPGLGNVADVVVQAFCSPTAVCLLDPGPVTAEDHASSQAAG